MRTACPFLCACFLGCGPAEGGGEDVAQTSQALQQCAAQTFEGVDVFDGQGTIDWAAVQAGGVRFAILKATQGTYDTQSTFAGNWARSKAAGVRRGAYHFFDPTEDGTAQASHFLSVVGALAPGDLPPTLDIECPDGAASCLSAGRAGQASAGDIRARLEAFLAAVEGATGRTPIVYTFAAYFTSNAVDTTGLDAYPLFLAYPSGAACFPVPSPWSSATLWQYSWAGRVPGVAVAVDRDRFLGTSAAFDALSGVSAGCP